MGIVIAHTAHLLSALVLFSLTKRVFPRPNPNAFALTAALLHIVSPAGIFLSAPFAESSCALLSFSGCLLFVKSLVSRGDPSARQDLLVLLSGALFGIATTFRSNGILNGLLLLEEAVRSVLKLQHGFRLAVVRRLLATGLGGILVATGFLLPQYIAYNQFCAGADGPVPRLWCEKSLPSIYTFVQAHYWYVTLFSRPHELSH